MFTNYKLKARLFELGLMDWSNRELVGYRFGE